MFCCQIWAVFSHLGFNNLSSLLVSHLRLFLIYFPFKSAKKSLCNQVKAYFKSLKLYRSKRMYFYFAYCYFICWRNKVLKKIYFRYYVVVKSLLLSIQSIFFRPNIAYLNTLNDLVSDHFWNIWKTLTMLTTKREIFYTPMLPIFWNVAGYLLVFIYQNFSLLMLFALIYTWVLFQLRRGVCNALMRRQVKSRNNLTILAFVYLL